MLEAHGQGKKFKIKVTGVITSLIYLVAVMLIGAWAVADCAARPHVRQEEGRGWAWKPALLWSAAWVVFHAVSLPVLLFAGNGPRLPPLLGWYGAATLLFPFFLAAGAQWTRRAGAPVLPLTRLATLVYHRPPHENQVLPIGRPGHLRILLEFTALALAPLLLLALLLHFVQWQPDPRLKTLFRPGEFSPFANFVLMLWMLTSAAVVEEVIFRNYLLMKLLALVKARAGREAMQNLTVQGWRFLLIVGCALLWSLGHSAMLQPEWLKYVQILLYGTALGIAQIRLGLEAAILLHLVYNLAAPYLA